MQKYLPHFSRFISKFNSNYIFKYDLADNTIMEKCDFDISYDRHMEYFFRNMTKTKKQNMSLFENCKLIPYKMNFKFLYSGIRHLTGFIHSHFWIYLMYIFVVFFSVNDPAFFDLNSHFLVFLIFFFFCHSFTFIFFFF